MVTIPIKVTEGEAQIIETLAMASGMTEHNWLKMIVRAAIAGAISAMPPQQAGDEGENNVTSQ